jgi:hypothetical protein
VEWRKQPDMVLLKQVEMRNQLVMDLLQNKVEW